MSPPKKQKYFAAGRQRPNAPSSHKSSFNIEQALAKGIKNHQTGNLQQAEQLYKKILSINPNHAATLHAQAILACQRGQHAAAVTLFQKAIHENPSVAVYHYNLGNALKDLGQVTEAVPCYQQVLLLNPAHLEALNNLGIIFHSQGRFDEAVSSYQKALELKSDHAEALYNLANTLQSQGRLQEALLYYQKTLEVKNDFPEVYNQLGNIFIDQGKADAAIGCFQYVLRLNPTAADGYFNLARALRKQGKLEEATSYYQKAIELAPTSAVAYNNLGNILRDQGRFIDAEACLRRALEILPNYAEAYSNLANIQWDQGRLPEAEASCRRALELMPDSPEMFSNLGNILKDQGRLNEAEESCRRALELKPDSAVAQGNLSSTLIAQGRLTEAEDSCRRALELDPYYAEAHSALLFILNYHPDQNGEAIFEAYREYDERFGIPLRGEWRMHSNGRETNRRLKVGYVSPDFRNHSVRHFLEPLLAYHDKEAVEVYAYAELAREDGVTDRYKGYVNHWVPTIGLTDAALAERVRADGIDILVDLAGQTAKNRLGVFARKPAPVSISWLGYGYTTGLTAIDYFLADGAMVPAGSEGLFAEAPWHLTTPGYTYRPAEGMGPVSPLPAAERGYITFGTLTRAIRINHRTIRVWSEILKRMPGSRLVIDSSNYKDTTTQTNLTEKFAVHGIGRERLEIGFHSPPWDMLRGMDIGLDCFPHNSGTTLFESLYMGVPFVTLAGRPSVGRLGASILEGVGHQEWIARTEDEYVEIAVALCSDLPQLANLRTGLREEMKAGPLMNEPAFARKVEAAYREMFAKWCEKNQ